MKFDGKSVERIGLFTRTYGNKGAVEFSSDDDTLLNEKEWIFVDVQQEFIPFFVESVIPKGKKIIVTLKHIVNINQAESLKRKIVFVNRSDGGNKNFSFSLENFFGFVVIDETTNQKLGTFTAIFSEQANPLMQISGEKEILVPLNGDFITKIDKSKKQIFLYLPDGFLDIY